MYQVSPKRINLNILECKVRLFAKSFDKQYSINLNILECKEKAGITRAEICCRY